MAGGRTTNEDGSEGVKLDSTELFIGGKWLTVGPLPVAVTGVRGVTLDNKVLMAGSIFPIYYQSYLSLLQGAPAQGDQEKGMISGYMMMQPNPGQQALSQCRKEEHGMEPVWFPSTTTSMITVSSC